MGAVAEVAADFQARQISLAARTASVVVGLWRGVNPTSMSASWGGVAARAALLVQRAQFVMAANVDPYMESVADAFGAVSFTEAGLQPQGFAAGFTDDGRPMNGLLLTGPINAKRAIASGFSVSGAMDAGAAALRTAVESQIAGAGSSASMVAMFMRDAPAPVSAEPFKGPGGHTYVKGSDGLVKPYFRPQSYVRMIQAGACSRCIILAGKHYHKQAPFLRHPRCHCTHIPVDENVDDYPATDPKAYYESLSPAERVKAFGKAGVDAIDAGADMNQVVNARQGMYVTKDGQKATREGTTKRGLYGATQRSFTKDGAPSKYTRTVQARLMPEEIFKIAGNNRDEAIRLLRQYSYIH
ncbi:hypothetical protein AB4Z38_07060 [Arthrobacter sp. 2RAF6]|uniref:hypothetical protein n=1 Tax=Arthrobacter sp. 2RAF6 TaxID=3233002 RepID=UPI003F91DDA8